MNDVLDVSSTKIYLKDQVHPDIINLIHAVPTCEHPHQGSNVHYRWHGTTILFPSTIFDIRVHVFVAYQYCRPIMLFVSPRQSPYFCCQVDGNRSTV